MITIYLLNVSLVIFRRRHWSRRRRRRLSQMPRSWMFFAKLVTGTSKKRKV